MLRVSRTAIASAAACLCLAVAVIAGCGLVRRGTGTVNLRITDGPYPVDMISEATVTITKVEALRASASQPSGDQAESAESEPADDGEAEASAAQAEDEGEWVTLFDGSRTFNLLDLRNGRTDLLADAEAPAGTYTQMRLIVTEGSIALTDGRTFHLKVPSGAQSGIKLHFVFVLNEGEVQSLLLDVDLSRAFKPIPGSGVARPEDIRQFHFQPSLAMRLINVVQAGSVTGTVSSAAGPLAGATVTALRDGTEVTSTTTEADGSYTLGGLPTGTYTIVFAADGYVSQEVADIAITAGQATEGVDAVLKTEPSP
jgi:hypothetical protein